MLDVWNISVSPFALGKLYLTACLILSFLQKGYCLHCVQCMAFNDGECVKGTLKASLCKGQDAHAKYCHKAIGHEAVGSGRIVYRTCSDIPLNNCTREKISIRKNSELATFKICHYSCSEEGCNTATTSTSRSGLPFALLLVISLLSYCIAADTDKLLLLSAL